MVQRVRKILISPPVLLLLAVVIAGAFATRDQWDWLLADTSPNTNGAYAPGLEDLDPDTERLYRITTGNGSTMSYSVDENLAGNDGTAEGTTEALAGDIAVNTVDPAASRLGPMVINVELLESDSSLRDKRIRHDFLESNHYPTATFQATQIEGIPEAVDGTASGDLTITGDLTIKEATAPVTFEGPVTVTDDALEATMSGTILMSTYDVGPIHVAGLAHTEDEVRFELDLVAERTDLDEAAPTDGGAEDDPVEFASAEFADTVQPILESSCVSCHEKGGPGYSTVEFDTAGQAAELASGIALTTTSRYMPPWPASDQSIPFEHDFSLSDEQIATVQEWADDGGGLDVDPDTPLEADDPPFEDIDRDQVIAQPEAYTGSLDTKDDYRCFIHEVEDPEEDGTWVTGVAFEPDQLEVVHHSIMSRAPAGALAEAQQRDGEDGRPGWECFGLAGITGSQSIGGWAPGQQPRVYPEGVGLYLQPGDFIINQIHYHYDHSTPADQSTVVLETLDSDELEERSEPMTPIRGRSYLTPAEGPCTPQEKGPLCDRDAVLDDIGEKYGIGATFIPDGLLARCGGTVDDYDDLDGTIFRSSCDLPAADHGTLFSVLGHMHEFGDAYRMTLNPDTPDERILLDIPSWSFEWQLYYVPTEQIRIEPGDMIRFECTWDRANLYMPEPRYITWNEGTVDEMCFSSVTVVPDDNVEGEPNGYFAASD